MYVPDSKQMISEGVLADFGISMYSVSGLTCMNTYGIVIKLNIDYSV